MMMTREAREMIMPWIAYPEAWWLCVGILIASLPAMLWRGRDNDRR